MPFDTTEDAGASEPFLGQDRAVEALRFGMGVRRRGYNMFVIGAPGVGKRTMLRKLLEEHAAKEERPPDACYVHGFEDARRPRAIELPSGTGPRLAGDMERALEELHNAMRDAFESEEHRTRKRAIVNDFTERREKTLAELQERAKHHDVAVVHSDTGIAVAPLHEGEPMEPAEFLRLSEEEQSRLKASMEDTTEALEGFLVRLRDWAREQHEAVEALDRDTAAAVAKRVIGAVREKHSDQAAVLEYLDHVEKDIVEHASELLDGGTDGVEAALRRAMHREQGDGPSRRYQVNVLVDHSGERGAPVVFEDNPTYANLVGRMEHESQFGALISHFTLIEPGALHRAAGGFLVLNVLDVLRHPSAWEAVKRTARTGEIRIEPLGRALGLVPTVSLEPDPVSFHGGKIVLVGERILYYLLAQLDPDFLELFRVLVDFEDSVDRGDDTQSRYARLVASVVKEEALRPFDRTGVARVIDHATRWAGDGEKLSVHMRALSELLEEADYWASARGEKIVTADAVQAAIDAQIHRADRVRERVQESIRRGDRLITTEGARIGQVNGLSVFQLGEHAFGQPTRITARVRPGKGDVVDIEREVKLGGPIHSKGVLILSGFLGARYGSRVPMSLSATLVFEQSYGGVEGDSASLAELCALLSALADVPMQQGLAITGSVDQLGDVQAIGGVNEKIEGFFDVCAQRGLTGDHGVLIPQSNVKNLVLRRDVIEAVESGKFFIHAVEHVDDAIALLTGEPAGAPDDAGRFPERSFNAKVEGRIAELTDMLRRARTRPSRSLLAGDSRDRGEAPRLAARPIALRSRASRALLRRRHPHSDS